MSNRHVRKIALDDVAPNRRRGGELRPLLTPSTVGSTSGFMGVAFIEPGEYITEHYHPYSEEFLYLVRGSLLVKVDGEPVSMRPGEALLIPKYARHRLENHGDERIEAVFHLGPLAERPEMGHVDTETLSVQPERA